MTRLFVLPVEAYYCLSTFFSFFVLCLIFFFSCLVAVIFFFLFLFLVYFLDVVCECVPSVIFPVQRTTSGVGDQPNRHNVRTTKVILDCVLSLSSGSVVLGHSVTLVVSTLFRFFLDFSHFSFFSLFFRSLLYLLGS